MQRYRLVRLSVILCAALILAPLASAAGPLPASGAVEAGLVRKPLACGDTQSTFNTEADSYQTVADCTLTTGAPVRALIFSSAGSGLYDPMDEYTGTLALRVDGVVETGAERKFSNGYNTLDGTNRSIALSVTRMFVQGEHHFELVVRRDGGDDKVALSDASLTVLLFPYSSAVDFADEIIRDVAVTSTKPYLTLQKVATNTITSPGPGWLIISSDANMRYWNGPAIVGVVYTVDTSTVTGFPPRYLSVEDSVPASNNKVLGYTAVVPLRTAGEHAVYMQMWRANEDGGVPRLEDVTLSLAFVPQANWQVAVEGSAEYTSTAVTSGLSAEIRKLVINLPVDTWVFVSADAYLHAYSAWVEGVFCLAHDYYPCDADTYRVVDVVPGNKESLAVSRLWWLPAGSHTIWLKAWRYTGDPPGILGVVNSSLMAVMPGGSLELPYVEK